MKGDKEMKKYRTSEAIAMLAEKPELRFKSQLGNEIYVDECGNIRWQETETTMGDIADLNHLFMKNMWELIQQPVSFMEAVKAYSEGKTIRCELDGDTMVYAPKITNDEYYVINACIREVLRGVWFVEVPNE
jgi:hypothetical protein